jgi:transposase
MANVLSEDKKTQVIALGKLGWSLRRIEQETGIRRETAGKYLHSAGVQVRYAGWRSHAGNQPPTDPGAAKPAIQATTDSGPVKTGSRQGGVPSTCEPFRDLIERELAKGRNAMGIWQDLVDRHGFTSSYQSIKRFVRRLSGSKPQQACAVIVTPPGEEGQVDYGSGPMVRDSLTGKYRRTRLFVLTLGFSRKAIRLLVFHSSTQIWAELHEKAFRRLGGCPKVMVLDNLAEGVLKPDIYDPELNPLYRDVLAHYGVIALPCRRGDPDRKGKVESAVGHAKRTPLKGKRFESLEEAQNYLDHWEERWADTRIHGTTKRQVLAMFVEEKPALLFLWSHSVITSLPRAPSIWMVASR